MRVFERFGNRWKMYFEENATNRLIRGRVLSDSVCDMFVTKQDGKTCLRSQCATNSGRPELYGEGKTQYKDCSNMIDTFLESIDDVGDADESQKQVTEAMIDLLNVAERREVLMKKNGKADDAAALSQCEVG